MTIHFDAADLRPLVQQIIGEVLTQIDGDRAQMNGKLSFGESTAAAMLNIPRHSLRDLRLSGRVVGCKLGKRIVYERSQLETLLKESRCQN